jgi:O-antigen/teichoic acid export membrane protein
VLAELLTSPLALVTLTVCSAIATISSYAMLGRITRPRNETVADDDIVRRVIRNSAIPIISQLFIRFADLAVAIVLLRLLGPEGNGRYALAVVLWLYVKTISDFGLTLLTTRDIARDRSRTGELVGATTLLRLVILGLTAVPVSVYALAGLSRDSLSVAGVLTIWILYLSIVPGSFAEAANSALNGFERMEVAAGINIGTSLIRAPLVVALAATDLSVVGVAIASLAATCVSAHLFSIALRRVTGQQPIWRLRRERALQLTRDSWPLLVNALLINLFFRVDVFIVQAFRGDAALGVYDASYKVINLVTIIPAYTTLAIFPALAQRGRDLAALEHARRLASYLLVWIAWGIVAVVIASAGTALRVLAGHEYLPESAILLRILIWFAPLSFLNGVLQYVLIAADEQRRIVPVFTSAVIFNAVGNMALIPVYGARAAAVMTVLTEVVILFAFALATSRSRRRIFRIASLQPLWKPTVAGASSAAFALWLAGSFGELVAIPGALLTFTFATLLLRVIGPEEAAVLRRALRRERAAHPAPIS